MSRQPLVEPHELKHELVVDDRFWLVRWYRFLYGSESTLTFCRLFWGTLLSVFPATLLGLTMPLWWPFLQLKRWRERRKENKRLQELHRLQARQHALRQQAEQQRREEAQLRRENSPLWQLSHQPSRLLPTRFRLLALQREEFRETRATRLERRGEQETNVLAHQARLEEQTRAAERALEAERLHQSELRLSRARELAWRELPLTYRLTHQRTREKFLSSHPVSDPGKTLPLPGVFHSQARAAQRGAERGLDWLSHGWALLTMRGARLSSLLLPFRWLL